MIQSINDRLDYRVHLDNTISLLQVTPIDSNATNIQLTRWLRGVAIANNLLLEIQDDLFILKNKDFANVVTIPLGNLDERFLNTCTTLGWDTFHYNGLVVIEYPTAHQPIIDNLQSASANFYEFEINITLLNHSDNKNKGIDTSQFIDFSIQQFDIVGSSSFKTLLRLPSITFSNSDIKYIQDNTISSVLSVKSGNTATSKIDQVSNVLTTQRDALGQITNQSITEFESGFSISLTAFPFGSECQVSVDLELSEDISTSDDPLPIISRRTIQNETNLALNETWLLAKFESNQVHKENKRTFKLPFTKDESYSQTMVIVAKRTK